MERAVAVQHGEPTARARLLMVAGSVVRVAYGIGALVAPAKMVSAQFAPDTHGLPDPRLLLRAFGGHQLVTGGLTLAAMRSPRLARPATALSLLIDTFDVTSALLELRARGRADQTLSGGIALSGSGIITFAAALRARPSASATDTARSRPRPRSSHPHR